MFKVKYKKTGKIYEVFATTYDRKRAHRQMNGELSRLTLFLVYDEEFGFSEVPCYEFEPIKEKNK